jgi:hypothetical protein
MDPQLKSVLTSIGLAAATAITTWAASKSLIPASDQVGDANAIVTVAGMIVMGGLAYFKTRAVTPKAMIASINDTNNGVKVVADNVIAKTETAPLK